MRIVRFMDEDGQARYGQNYANDTATLLEGDEITGLVETSDLAPTFLDYAGVDIPPQMPTRSLRPMIESGEKGREWILCEYTTNDRSQKAKCIRTERYKYIHYLELEGMDELYDLEVDPYETNNIIDLPESQEILEALKEELSRQLEEAK